MRLKRKRKPLKIIVDSLERNPFAELTQSLKALIFVAPAEPIFKRVTSRSHDADYFA